MSKFLLTDWEINGPSDSDFMASYYDEDTNKIGFICYGSTRYPSSTIIGIGGSITTVIVDGDNLLMPTAEVVEKARLVLEDNIYLRLQQQEKRLVEEPDVADLKVGIKVRLTAKAKMQLRETSICHKCNSSGKWINPRNPNDQRECFYCKGSGQNVGGKLKDENGKQAYNELPAGLIGEVIDWGSHGTFFSNGYSKPSRNNTTVQFRTADGKVVRASLSKLRLDRNYKSDSYLRGTAKEMSYAYGFSTLYPRFAWDTHNFAAQVAKKDSQLQCFP